MNWNTAFFDKIRGKRVLVIGDVMLDRYFWGNVNRISPEAPVPILHLTTSDNRLGGAANVALNLAGLDLEVSLIGHVGDDANGAQVRALADDAGILIKGLLDVKGWTTTTKTRVISGHQHLLRVDDECAYTLAPSDLDILKQQISAQLNEHTPDAVILEDYNKGVFSEEIINHTLQAAGEQGVPVLVDPKYDHFLDYRNVALFKPNLREVRASVPFDVNVDVTSLDRASSWLRGKLNHGITCITLSDRGMYLDDGNASGIYPTVAYDVVDVCGAGDAVISVLAASLISGLSLDQMSRLANLAGGLVCAEVGVSTVPKAGLRAALEHQSFS